MHVEIILKFIENVIDRVRPSRSDVERADGVIHYRKKVCIRNISNVHEVSLLISVSDHSEISAVNKVVKRPCDHLIFTDGSLSRSVHIGITEDDMVREYHANVVFGCQL